jgi:hypothetical protein
MRVTNGIPFGSSLLLPVCTVNCVQTLKALHLLKLNGNQLTSLPQCTFSADFSFAANPFGRLMLNNNNLTSIPDGLLRLPNLGHLNLANNALSVLDQYACIGNAKTKDSTEGTLAEEAEERDRLEMIEIDLSHNNLVAMAPVCIQGLPNLIADRLAFWDNPLACTLKRCSARPFCGRLHSVFHLFARGIVKDDDPPVI